MIACGREFLKAHERLEQLVEAVRRAGEDGHRIDEVEHMLFAELLAKEFDFISTFAEAADDGDVGETLYVSAGSDGSSAMPNEEPPTATSALTRLPEPHNRR
jgi:hypothetical protein